MNNRFDLTQLKAWFNNRLSKSLDREALIEFEIQHVESELREGPLREAYLKYVVAGLEPQEWYAPAREGEEVAFITTEPQPPTADPFEFDFSKARKYKLMPPLQQEVELMETAKTRFKYLQWLQTLRQPEAAELIVRRGCLELIWDKYNEYFKGETPESWLQRFNKDAVELQPIQLSKAAREDSDRLVLIAILASIQDATGNAFDFSEFVKKNFGVNDFQVTKSRNKEKQTFKDITRYCKSILNK